MGCSLLSKSRRAFGRGFPFAASTFSATFTSSGSFESPLEGDAGKAEWNLQEFLRVLNAMYKPSCKKFSYMETTPRTGIYRRCSVYLLNKPQSEGVMQVDLWIHQRYNTGRHEKKETEVQVNQEWSMPFIIDIIKIKNRENQPLLTTSPGRGAATIQCITIHSALGIAIEIKQQSARKIGSNKHLVYFNELDL